jgi:protein TonB
LNRHTPPPAPRRDPVARAHYAGLRRRERTLIAGCNAAALLAALALLLSAKPVTFYPPPEPDPISIFEVPPPPLPPPPSPPERQQIEPPRISTAKPQAAPGGRKASPPPVPSPAAPAPILALAPPSPLIHPEAPGATTPAPGVGRSGDGTGQGAGRGSGNGTGNGAGSGAGSGGGGVRFARADWIEKPTRADFEREWPAAHRQLQAEVRVVVACYVKPSGRPHRCKVAAINNPLAGFGPAAIRLVQGARVKPVRKNGQALDLPILAPIAFWPAPKAASRNPKDHAEAK